MKVKITFLGDEEHVAEAERRRKFDERTSGGDVKSVTWEGGPTFNLDEPLEFDTDDVKNGELNKQIVRRAQENRFFRVEVIPNDTAVRPGKKSVVDEPVTNIDRSKEAMQAGGPLQTEQSKEEQARRDTTGASRQAEAASRNLARGEHDDGKGVKSSRDLAAEGRDDHRHKDGNK